MTEDEELSQIRVGRLNTSFESASAYFLLEHILTFEFRDKIALVSSFGTEAAILLHMVSQIRPELDIVFIDTQKLFTLTHKYREQLTDLFGLKNVKIFTPAPNILKEQDPQGDLWSRDTKKCCDIRKVTTTDLALKPYKSWITGRKRSHGGSRLHMKKFEWVDGVIKINPLANWKTSNINHYFDMHNIPRHPLYERGFLSVGCHHCSAPSSDPNNPRSGRWQGQEKTECGIHKSS